MIVGSEFATAARGRAIAEGQSQDEQNRRESEAVARWLGYVRAARNTLDGTTKIGIAETHDQFLRHPELINAADVVVVHIHPYWEGIAVEAAAPYLGMVWRRMQALAKGKRLVLGETGWPSEGAQHGNAVPSPANAARYFRDVVSWAESQSVEYFYHEAFDIDFKAAHEGGARWGIFDAAGNLKPGMDEVLRGARSDTLMHPVPGGAGSSPDIIIDEFSEPGSPVKLRGRVLHVDPALVAIHMFLHVDGRWWPKPTFAQSFVLAGADGSWEAGPFDDGNDRHVDAVSILVLPITVRTAFTGSLDAVPASLVSAAVARTTVAR